MYPECGHMANLRECWVAPVAPVVKGHEAAEELVSHHTSRPQVTGWVEFRIEIFWGQEPWRALQAKICAWQLPRLKEHCQAKVCIEMSSDSECHRSLSAQHWPSARYSKVL